MALRNGLSECGDSSPLLLAATRRGESSTADKSAAGKAAASYRTPKIAAAPVQVVRRYGGRNSQEGRISATPDPTIVTEGRPIMPAAHGSRPKPSYRPRRGRTVRPFQRRYDLLIYCDRRFHLRLLTVFPLRGTKQRSNLFESHWSNQWLTLELHALTMTADDWVDCDFLIGQ